MKRVAVVTDIHGNLPALEASLEAIEAIAVEEVYCGGAAAGRVRGEAGFGRLGGVV